MLRVSIGVFKSRTLSYIYKLLTLDTVNDKSYAREKSFAVFTDFRWTAKVFPTNAVSNGNTFNTDQAKLQKFSLHLDEIQ